MAGVTSLQVFISFSRQDIGLAEKVCKALEANGVQCWMAHRDTVPGSGYLGPVLEAADHCRAVIVLFSSSITNSNIYVLERTAARSVSIIWVMLDQAEAPAEFKRFKESSLVIDAFTLPLESNLRSLVVMVKSLLYTNRAGDRHEMSHGFVSMAPKTPCWINQSFQQMDKMLRRPLTSSPVELTTKQLKPRGARLSR